MSILKSHSIRMASGIAAAIFAGSLAAQGLDQLKDITGGAARRRCSLVIGFIVIYSVYKHGKCRGNYRFLHEEQFPERERMGQESIAGQARRRRISKPAKATPIILRGRRVLL